MKKFWILCVGVSLFAQSDLLELDLEDLSALQYQDTLATLTKTDVKNTPATITIITHDDIVKSGARNLDDLLEIFVPSFSYMYKVQGTQMGMRGIISDRNNKILLLVNGRVMNIKATDGGAVTERWFSMLDDIERIKVITGPGSAIYGLGAIAGVISIETCSAKTRPDGVSITAGAGSKEEFYNAQLSYSKNFDNGLGVYIYYGLDKYVGASSEAAPMQFAFDYDGRRTYFGTITSQADTPYPVATTNNYNALENDVRHKFHFQLENDSFTFWARFTRSSIATPTQQAMFRLITPRNAHEYKDTGTKNQQLTLFTQFRQKVNTKLSLEYELSYQRDDVFTRFYNSAQTLEEFSGKSWGEDNIVAKVVANYDYNDENQLALGMEYSYNWFGRKSALSDLDLSIINPLLEDGTKWESYVVSTFAEYQGHFDNWTLFLGGRVDKHRFSKTMYSPRINLVYNLKNRHIFKLGYNRSTRNSDDVSLYISEKINSSYGDVENIDTLEFNYSNYIDNFHTSFTAFFNKEYIIAWNDEEHISKDIGDVESYGCEIELSYITPKIVWNISHSYTQLAAMDLADVIKRQNISAKPYGYGSDFANWHNHITKMRFEYKFDKKWRWNNYLRVFWGIPGAQDMADYNKEVLDASYKLPLYDAGHTQAFEESMFFDTSIVWSVSKQTTVSFNGYNLLGLLDDDLNKRNFFFTTSQYRIVEPSAALWLRHKF